MARSSLRSVSRLAVYFAALGLRPAFPRTTAWTPTKPIEVLVGVSPGGGIDRTARTLQKIMQEKRLVATPVNVVNKPGGGSTIVQAYLNTKARYYEIMATSLLTSHITGKSASSHRDFTHWSGEVVAAA